MTIGKSSMKSLRSCKFLDQTSGFYWRLDEAEMGAQREGVRTDQEQAAGMTGAGGGEPHPLTAGGNNERELGIFDFNQGMTEDEGTTTLLREKPSRRSSRWRRSRRSTSRKENQAPVLGGETALGEGAPPPPQTQGRDRPLSVHFSLREEADDQVLISQKEQGRRTKDQQAAQQIKAVKRNTLRSYGRAIDHALRRGWETLITNLHSVTLSPISSSSSSPTSSS